MKLDYYGQDLLNRTRGDLPEIWGKPDPHHSKVKIACLEHPGEWQLWKEGAAYVGRPPWASISRWDVKQHKQPDGNYTLFVRYMGQR